MGDDIKPKCETISSLARKYEVSRKLMKQYLEPFWEEIGKDPKIRVFTPKQVELIYTRLGKP